MLKLVHMEMLLVVLFVCSGRMISPAPAVFRSLGDVEGALRDTSLVGGRRRG